MSTKDIENKKAPVIIQGLQCSLTLFHSIPVLSSVCMYLLPHLTEALIIVLFFVDHLLQWGPVSKLTFLSTVVPKSNL